MKMMGQHCFMRSTFSNKPPHTQKELKKKKRKPNQLKSLQSKQGKIKETKLCDSQSQCLFTDTKNSVQSQSNSNENSRPFRFSSVFPCFEGNPTPEMGKTGTKLPSFCLNRIRPHVRVPIQSKLDSVSVKTGPKKADDCVEGGEVGAKPGLGNGRKIMIVVDSTIEAEGALQWALSHTVQNQDKIVLLHVIKPSRKGEGLSKETSPRAYELVHSMRNLCQLKRPEVEVEVAVVEGGKEKGSVIVEEARKQEASLLVLGQKKRSTTWRLLMVWAGHRWGGGGGGGGGGAVEYCIQNASCMAIAVRRKSKKLGGYLITTKRQKDFWLLA
ncbi:hypothetical protein SDJN02_06306 [Cucurbita argyrosperma subsp. argyrosperma]|nr:hypothetical protein SDJN02_06306 [Cucurbita argyrosperma subsp. argyrosperma]